MVNSSQWLRHSRPRRLIFNWNWSVLLTIFNGKLSIWNERIINRDGDYWDCIWASRGITYFGPKFGDLIWCARANLLFTEITFSMQIINTINTCNWLSNSCSWWLCFAISLLIWSSQASSSVSGEQSRWCGVLIEVCENVFFLLK